MKTDHNQIMQLKQNFNDFRTHFPKIFLVKPENINTTKYTVFKLMNVQYRLLPETYNFKFLDQI